MMMMMMTTPHVKTSSTSKAHVESHPYQRMNLLGIKPTSYLYPHILLHSSFSSGIFSLIILAVISYERYCTMMAPTIADGRDFRPALGGICFSCLYSVVWTVPPLLGWSRYGPEGPGTTCSVDWKTQTLNNVSYIVCLFVFCLLLPFCVILHSYGKLLLAIRQVGVRRHCGLHSVKQTCPVPAASQVTALFWLRLPYIYKCLLAALNRSCCQCSDAVYTRIPFATPFAGSCAVSVRPSAPSTLPDSYCSLQRVYKIIKRKTRLKRKRQTCCLFIRKKKGKCPRLRLNSHVFRETKCPVFPSTNISVDTLIRPRRKKYWDCFIKF